MKNIFTILIFIFVSMKCHAQFEEGIDSSETRLDPMVKKRVVDTIYIDTLVWDNVIEKFKTHEFKGNQLADEIVFSQVIFNTTPDTLELMARAGAGWVVPVFQRKLYPYAYSKIFYYYSVENHNGRVNTRIDIQFTMKKDNIEVKKHVNIILNAWIE